MQHDTEDVPGFSNGRYIGTGRVLTDADAARFREALKDVEPELRDRIREERDERGWSQAQLSRELQRIGLSLDPTAITRMEKGTRSIRAEEVWALAAVFQVSLDALLTVSASTASASDRLAEARRALLQWEQQALLAEGEAAGLRAQLKRLEREAALEAEALDE